MSEQLALDLDRCPYAYYLPDIDRTICTEGGRKVYTTCHRGICGEPPRCTLEEPDNSPEAVSRRLAWLREHKEEE